MPPTRCVNTILHSMQKFVNVLEEYTVMVPSLLLKKVGNKNETSFLPFGIKSLLMKLLAKN